jgi:O-methyltransferase involved in polyketide biosynthesis
MSVYAGRHGGTRGPSTADSSAGLCAAVPCCVLPAGVCNFVDARTSCFDSVVKEAVEQHGISQVGVSRVT